MEQNPAPRDGGRRKTLAGLPRRTVLKASAVTAGALGFATPVAAEQQDEDGEQTEDSGGVDEPEGFEAEVVAPYATFPDDVAAEFRVGEDGETATLADASTMVVVRATWEPGGTTGWHTHPGPVVVSVVDGSLDVAFADDCATQTYEAGEAFVDPGGHAELASNPSESETTTVSGVFLGVPDGDDLLTWVEPPDC